jgi:hypothetical protein
VTTNTTSDASFLRFILSSQLGFSIFNSDSQSHRQQQSANAKFEARRYFSLRRTDKFYLALA